MQSVYKNLILFLVLALLIVGYIAYGNPGSGPTASKTASSKAIDNEARIIANGTGDATVDPDRASVNASIISEGATPETAEMKNREKTNIVIFTLKSLSSVQVQDKDITTKGCSLQPIYAYPDGGKPEPKGYRMENIISVRVSNIKTTGAIIGALTSAGVDSIPNVDYSVSRSQDLRDKALQRACRNATHRAQVIAETMGMKLGEAVLVKDGAIMTETPVPVFKELEVSAEPIPDAYTNPEKIRVTATCEITYKLRRP